MNKIVHKIISLFLVISIMLITLYYTDIITFSSVVYKCICFGTIVFMIIASTAEICSNTTAFNKFINYLIIVGTLAGILWYIVYGSFNYIIYITLLCTLVSSLMDLFYKKN